MGIINKVKNFFNVNKKETNDINSKEVYEMLTGDIKGNNLSEVTYFTCIKMLSESLGKLTLKFYQETDKGVMKGKKSQVYELLKTRPNPNMTPSIFWATVEYHRNHYGNAYVWVRWFKGNLIDLWVLDPKNVRIMIDNIGLLGNRNAIYYKYIDSYANKEYVFSQKEILHFKTGVSEDGITGMAIQDILRSSMEGNKASQNFMNKLYKTGLTAKAVLQYTGDLDDKKKTRLVKGFENFASGSDNAGRIIPVPLGMTLTPLDIKLTDSQFFELKKYSSLQIAAAFGIKPNHLNDYSKSSYANSEMQNLSFYTDTLLFILTQYEQELKYKLLSEKEIQEGYYFRFNVNSILRADSKTQMESLAIGVNNGIYTPNEARAYLDKANIEGGDRPYANGNIIPLEKAGKQYDKGGD